MSDLLPESFLQESHALGCLVKVNRALVHWFLGTEIWPHQLFFDVRIHFLVVAAVTVTLVERRVMDKCR